MAERHSMKPAVAQSSSARSAASAVRQWTRWPERRRRERQGAQAGETWPKLLLRRLRNLIQRWPILPLIIAVGLLALTETSSRLLHRTQTTMADNEAMRLASDIRSRLESELNKLLYITSGLASYMQLHADNLDDHEIEQLLASLYQHAEHLKNIGIAVGYELRYVYPLKGNRNAIGLDYRKVPSQLPDVEKVFKTGQAIITPRIALVQGGHGVIYRSPIFVNDKVWGLLSTVVDIDQLLASALQDIPSSRFEYAIFDRDAQHSLLWGQPAVREATQRKVLTTESGWMIAVIPTLAPHQSAMDIGFRLLGYLLSLLLAASVHAIQKHRRDLLHLSRHDPLTGLANRRSFDERLQLACARVQRDPGVGFSLAIIDLNNFKPINDQYGHIVGDQVLKTVAERLQASTRSIDLVSRWGGDEYGLLIEQLDSVDLDTFKRRILSAIREPIQVHSHELQVNASLGLVQAPADGLSAHALLSVADERMYQNKAPKLEHATPQLSPAG